MSRTYEIQLPLRPVLSHSADAVRTGDLLFVAGVLPLDQAGSLVGEGDVSTQARRVFDDLGETAGTLVGVSGLAVPGARIEVDAVAVVR